MNINFAPNYMCRTKRGRWCHNANVLHSYDVLILTSNRPSLVAMVKWIINVCLHWVHVSSKHDIMCKEQNAISLNYEVINPWFSLMNVICLYFLKLIQYGKGWNLSITSHIYIIHSLSMHSQSSCHDIFPFCIHNSLFSTWIVSITSI